MAIKSPFLRPGPTSAESSLAILHLRRDQLLPTVLQPSATDASPPSVSNTRFGSFPHNTLVDVPWGSQILASNVESRGRGSKKSKKRKLEEDDQQQPQDGEAMDLDPPPAKQLKSSLASSGFCHILPPTPESWTVSLPHRTQVVYTPDYSFVLQKLRARPGSVLIEAGAGSGSFTHAAARAVFNGYPEESIRAQANGDQQESDVNTNDAAIKKTKKQPQRHGKVYSFEYHEPRSRQLQDEIVAHGLEGVVQVTHRDVYADGFCVPDSSSSPSSPLATAVFLDLPAPWMALPHLSRHPPSGPSPLSPQHAVHLTCFLPCIEQVTKAIASLRTHGWTDITMFSLAQRRLDVRRERIGLHLEGLRGVNASAGSVAESVARLREVETRQLEYRGLDGNDDDEDDGNKRKSKPKAERESKQERLARIAREAEDRKVFKEGRLVHRTEPEIKTHTSYLVFAILPREWTDEDERACREKWPVQRTEEIADVGDTEKTAKKNKKS